MRRRKGRKKKTEKTQKVMVRVSPRVNTPAMGLLGITWAVLCQSEKEKKESNLGIVQVSRNDKMHMSPVGCIQLHVDLGSSRIWCVPGYLLYLTHLRTDCC